MEKSSDKAVFNSVMTNFTVIQREKKGFMRTEERGIRKPHT